MKTTTILFDLDGTLLPMDLDLFLNKYFAALTKCFGHAVEPESFIKSLYASTMAMVRNNDPKKTNEQVFMSDFFQRVPLKQDETMPRFDDFYRTEFPKLKEQIDLKLEGWRAKDVVEAAFAKGFTVVIATNPLFPLMAIEERLRWVGLGGYPYKLVTSYEVMHFCKPNPNYFQEICERIHVDPRACLMVGNDMEEDLPASTLGMKTYIVEDFLIDRRSGSFTPDARGSMNDLYQEILHGELLMR